MLPGLVLNSNDGNAISWISTYYIITPYLRWEVKFKQKVRKSIINPNYGIVQIKKKNWNTSYVSHIKCFIFWFDINLKSLIRNYLSSVLNKILFTGSVWFNIISFGLISTSYWIVRFVSTYNIKKLRFNILSKSLVRDHIFWVKKGR